jgi:PAS domain S-box-containing protein
MTPESDERQMPSLLWAMLESAPVAMLMVDSTGHIVLLNRETELLFGYARDELLGKPVDILVPARSRDRHPQLRAEFLEKPAQRRMGAGRDLYGVRRDGSEVPIEIGLNPIKTDGDVFVLSAIVDITLRKGLEAATRENEVLEQRVRERTVALAAQAEELTRVNQALERSNMELQQFAYVASHDLQSPLRSVSGFVQLLQRRYDAQLDAQAREWIQGAADGAKRMNRLIRDLLEFSRVDTRAHPFTTVDMNEVVTDALALLDAPMRDDDAEIHCDALPTVSGDRSQLVQLMQNLVGNAIKYRGADKPLVSISAANTPEGCRFTVRDNGIGIAAEHHEKIFEVFRRLHNHSAYPGTGIGLAVCRRVVHRHGGTLWVESSPGQGSAFHFTLSPAAGEGS